ncbi:hypothetical protein V1478_008896 [Vespula squamosa]|uniref:Uncharacterized protein n=1 Tax=Vespula squamosa TaxID=30214 RepID=A0ABD2AUT3_VESSQ
MKCKYRENPMSAVNANQKKLPSIETRVSTRSTDRFGTLEIRGGDYRASTASCRSLSWSSSSKLESSQSGSFGGVEGEIPVEVRDRNRDTTVKSLIIPGNTSQATDHNRDTREISVKSLIIPGNTSQISNHTKDTTGKSLIIPRTQQAIKAQIIHPNTSQVTDDRIISEITTDYTAVIGELTRSSSSLKTFD